MEYTEEMAELIIEKEAELGRELTELEKVAVLGTAMKLGAKYLPKVFNAAKDWGNAVNGAYKLSSGKLGPTMAKPTAGSIGKAMWNASKTSSPGMHKAVVGTTGYGAYTGASKLMSPKQPNMTVVAEEVTDSIIKEAANSEDKKKERDNLLFLIGGLGAGALLGSRGIAMANKAKTNALLSKTESLRGVGKELAGINSAVKADKAEDFARMFEGIADPKHKKVVQDTVTDIDKLIDDTSRAMNKPGYSSIRKEEVADKLRTGLYNAADKGELPSSAVKYLEKSIDKNFRPRDNSFVGQETVPRGLGVARDAINAFMHPEIMR